MNIEEKTREWVDMTDGAVANTIFGEHGVDPADVNLDDDSPSHTEDNHSLMQRATDAQFLRMLARRSGKLFRVFCTDTPGKRTGWFGKPSSTVTRSGPAHLNDTASTVVGARDLLGRDAPDRGHRAAGAVHRNRSRRRRRHHDRPRAAAAGAARARRFRRQSRDRAAHVRRWTTAAS